jgi:hypothetical protein
MFFRGPAAARNLFLAPAGVQEVLMFLRRLPNKKVGWMG